MKENHCRVSWPKFSGTGAYEHIKLICYIYGFFLDVPSIENCCITAILNTEFRVRDSICYTEMKEGHRRYSVDNNQYDWCLRQSKRLKAIDPQINIQMRNKKLLTQMPGELENAVKCRCNQNCTLDDIANTLEDLNEPRERVAEVAKKKKSCHNCGSTDHYANNCPKVKERVYGIENVPEEESPTEDSESDSMGFSIREQSDDDQDPRKELLV
ncbi:hypothetical protein O181_058020 [Austropuccinia psidii MF-1]|uniref:CCHC-type domain-containing protein n=1 Tax=Austropuccinia psidii MF-1 TaxID=1389203 RepID=A0A9Q3HXH5_9BASI|nr:hypothetical protein [Austropuccinia psidii MF-1]